MKNWTMQWGNREHLGRIGLCVGLMLLFSCLGFAPALASVLELPSALTKIADEAFMNDTVITSVIIPDGATSIGARAFAGCGNLETITVPDSVTDIGEDAFLQCGKVMIICNEGSAAEIYAKQNGIAAGAPMITEIPHGLKYRTYSDHVVLTGYAGSDPDLILPEYIEGLPVTEIAESAFENNTVIQHVQLPRTLKNIHDFAFNNCSNLTGDLFIPNSVTHIGAFAFSGCAFDGRLTLSENLTQINHGVFCKSGFIGDLVIPDQVTSIGNMAFYHCTFNGTLTLSENLEEILNSAFQSVPFTGDLIIPDNVIKIESGAFLYYYYEDEEYLEWGTVSTGFNGKLVLGKNLQTIGNQAFHGCLNLKGDLIIPDSVTSIGEMAFADCQSLDGRLQLSKNLTKIPNMAFFECYNLTGNLIIPNGITSIGDSAFSAEKIMCIYIPSSVKHIDDYALWGLAHNLLIYGEAGSYAETFAEENGYTFILGTAAEMPDIPAGLEFEIYDTYVEITNSPIYATEIVLPAYIAGLPVKSIGYYAFGGRSYLSKIVIPDTVTTIGDWAFCNCDSLMSIYLSENVTSISEDTFYGAPVGFTIYGVSGSYAETYAAENGIVFSTAPFPGTETEPDEETITLSGSVTFADGTPVEDAYVYVYDTVAADWIALEYTDRNGNWACSVPADGSYTIHYLHDVYSIAPAEVSVSPTADMTLDTAIASLVGGEGTATPVFVMQMNGVEIPAAGVKVGDVVTFSITAEGATKVRLVADGVAYNEYWLTDGSATIERGFTRAGTRQIAFQAYDGRDWGAVCEAQTLIVTADGTLDAPVIHAIDTQYVGESFTVTWDAVENAESYTVYLYRNELLWPALSNTDRSTTTGLSMEIPGDLLYTDGEYLIEIIASGYGYSQSSASVKFTVEETAAGVEITYPTDGMTYSIGDTMHTRYAMGSGTQGVRLLVAPPVGEPVLYAPDESGIFYPIADQVGDYVLTPYYSTSEGDFTAETADGAGESVTVTVQKPAISSLTQGTNKQYSIRYTGTAQDFAGSVSNARYTVKVYLNDAFVKDITPEEGEFAFTTDTLTETGKYVYSFVPCYGDITGEPKEFPVYMVEQGTESITKYAGEPMMLLDRPDGSVKDSIAYGAEVTILGKFGTEYLYVSVNGKDGFIAAESKLVEAVEPGNMEIVVTSAEDAPYYEMGAIRHFTVSVEGAHNVAMSVILPNGEEKNDYQGIKTEEGTIFEIPLETAGRYMCIFSAEYENKEKADAVKELFFVVDTSYENAGKECWSKRTKCIVADAPMFVGLNESIDVTEHRMTCIGKAEKNYIYVLINPEGQLGKYYRVLEEDIQFEKNVTEYQAVCIVNPYSEKTYDGDMCEKNAENINKVLNKIENIDIIPVYGQEGEVIDRVLQQMWNDADYNDVTYIYWSGHGQSTGIWSVLPYLGEDDGNVFYEGYNSDRVVNMLINNRTGEKTCEGKVNVIIDACYSGVFANILNDYDVREDAGIAVLMATTAEEEGIVSMFPGLGSGGLFTKKLKEYVLDAEPDGLKLSDLRDNVKVEAVKNWEWSTPTTTIWGDPNRIFFAEDPDAVN